ncbi:hypothetical protein PG994_015288 [Apiospora phragmitis]|uniref:Uncharacterized protein n=1 Tax=Apiospora phragmitis TaxID=2905665 RepID=A0ABR1SR50_9PEZI
MNGRYQQTSPKPYRLVDAAVAAKDASKMMPNTLILVVGEGVINLFSTYLLLYKSRRTPPPKYSHGIIKCRLDVYTVLCRSLDKSAAQLERQSMALLSRYHSLRFDIALVPNKQYGPEVMWI